PLLSGVTHFSVDPAEFAGKRVLVTGGTKGMGEAIVRRLAAGGATVATTARSPLPESQAVELFVQADISTREGVDRVVREMLDRLGGVDILVNNVGGSSAPSGGVLARRRGLAEHYQHQPARRRPPRPRAAARHAGAGSWRHHSNRV